MSKSRYTEGTERHHGASFWGSSPLSRWGTKGVDNAFSRLIRKPSRTPKLQSSQSLSETHLILFFCGTSD
jgi:hypothetical protein